MKKIFLPLILAAATLTTSANAQIFELEKDTSITITAGSTEDIYVYNTLTNISDASIDYSYRLVNWETFSMPIGWNIVGFCDNLSCWPANTWDAGQTRNSGAVAPGEVSDLKLQINVSPTADNGTAFFHFEVKTTGQTSNAFYELTKTPTGMSLVPVSDLSINLYPNPNNGAFITMYVGPKYAASRFIIHDVAGKQIANIQSNGAVTQQLNIQDLSAGIYTVQVVDTHGAVIANRNFVKK